jgi:enoyl-CoA hydratase/carnithine racemase
MDLVSYRLDQSIATITLDDGKVNALSPAMQSQIHRALDQAAADRAVVVLTGRPGVWTAGFDLSVLRAGGADGVAMVRGGFVLAERLMTFPQPTIIACSGHAIAMGLFLMLSADYRLAASGPFKLTANEVAIGLPMPRVAIALCRQRLTPAHLHRALTLAEVFTPEDAIAGGFVDRVVPAGELAEAARQTAVRLAALDRNAHTLTKQRVHEATLQAMHTALTADDLLPQAR